jgi:hypothetical protein
MTVRASQSVTRVFTLRRTDTQAAANADSLPTGTLYVNGTADAATVTITNITTGVYKAAVTMPSGLVIGDVVDLRISATVNSVSDNAIIWQDLADVAINSSGAVTAGTVSDKTGYSLTQTFPTNFSALAITAGGSVTAGTVSDKTGYSLASSQTFSTTGAVGSVTAGVTVTTNNDKTGYALTQLFPSNFSSLAINSSGHVSRVVLVDTTTTNTDMRGTDNAALASVWTATRGSYLDAAISSRSSHTAADVWTSTTRTLSSGGVSSITGGVWDELLTAHTTAGTFGAKLLRSINTTNEVKVVGSGHVAADVHESQPNSIHATTFEAGAIDAAALASDAASEIASAVRTNLTDELGRIDVAISTRLATSGYTTPPTAATIADTVLGRSVVNVEATAAEHSLCTLILGATESAISGSTWTIYETDGSTTYRTKTITTDATANPITAVT